MIPQDLADMIRHGRIRFGMSQAELARAVNMRPAEISRWERCISLAEVAKYLTVAEFLGCELVHKGTQSGCKPQEAKEFGVSDTSSEGEGL